MTTTHIDENTLKYLCSKLKKEDKVIAGISKAFVIVCSVLLPLYLYIVIDLFSRGKELSIIVANICTLGGLLILFWSYRNNKRKYGGIDYSEPTLMMLKKAAKRYRALSFKSITFIIGLFMLHIGLYINVFYNTPLFIQVSFFFTIIIAIVVGIIIWKNRYKPLRDDSLKLIKEIES
ncbi:hypothetical protein [Labilibacter marinus]|uniref:hypothetical protein n=1 Tax=Labilibacter marinus TaxID=1477105 RepID=UPI00083197B8|nr:hypothetical protein [Labilibacter marinus]